MKPIRIQPGWKIPPNTVYVGRPCHADVLLELANAPGHTDLMVSPESLDVWLEDTERGIDTCAT